MAGFKLLIIEDKPRDQERFAELGQNLGFSVTVCSRPEEADLLISKSAGHNAGQDGDQDAYDVVLSDLHTGGRGELRLLKSAKARNRDTVVIIITDSDSVSRAVEAVNMGAYRYLTKPFRFDELETILRQVREQCLMRAELTELRNMMVDTQKSTIIGKSPAIQDVKEFIEKVAPLECTILLEGETGTGKEFFARLIHQNSMRADKNFFAVNCGAFTEELLSNELFGHEKEAFTGAGKRQAGIFETADGGTLLLDEVSEMPLLSQVKLLRVLQEGTVLRVGGTREVPVDVRVIAASNRVLQDEVTAGAFRKDLFYRLNIIRVAIPPLRERAEDISLFCHFFLAKFSAKYGKRIEAMSDEAMRALYNYSFPGNVRELINTIERAVILADATCIERNHLPRRILDNTGTPEPSFSPLATLAEVEAAHIQNVLDTVNGKKSEAARILGIDPATLWRKLKRIDSSR